MPAEPSVMVAASGNVTAAATDPVKAIAGILATPNLSDSDRVELVKLAHNRFRHRRRMAYIALWTVVGSLVAILGAAFIDAGTASDPKILESIAPASTLLAWLEGFLTAIVAAYYGISAWRPAS